MADTITELLANAHYEDTGQIKTATRTFQIENEAAGSEWGIQEAVESFWTAATSGGIGAFANSNNLLWFSEYPYSEKRLTLATISIRMVSVGLAEAEAYYDSDLRELGAELFYEYVRIEQEQRTNDILGGQIGHGRVKVGTEAQKGKVVKVIERIQPQGRNHYLEDSLGASLSTYLFTRNNASFTTPGGFVLSDVAGELLFVDVKGEAFGTPMQGTPVDPYSEDQSNWGIIKVTFEFEYEPVNLSIGDYKYTDRANIYRYAGQHNFLWYEDSPSTQALDLSKPRISPLYDVKDWGTQSAPLLFMDTTEAKYAPGGFYMGASNYSPGPNVRRITDF